MQTFCLNCWSLHANSDASKTDPSSEASSCVWWWNTSAKRRFHIQPPLGEEKQSMESGPARQKLSLWQANRKDNVILKHVHSGRRFSMETGSARKKVSSKQSTSRRMLASNRSHRGRRLLGSTRRTKISSKQSISKGSGIEEEFLRKVEDSRRSEYGKGRGLLTRYVGSHFKGF